LLERRDERVLRQLLRQAHVAHQAREPRDEPPDSILQRASMVRWASVAVMATDDTIVACAAQAKIPHV